MNVKVCVYVNLFVTPIRRKGCNNTEAAYYHRYHHNPIIHADETAFN